MEVIAFDYFLHKAIERIIEVIVTEAIDINQHIIAETGEGKVGFDYGQTFGELAKLGVFPKKFGNKIAKSAGLRNILAHRYRELDD